MVDHVKLAKKFFGEAFQPWEDVWTALHVFAHADDALAGDSVVALFEKRSEEFYEFVHKQREKGG